MLRRKERNQPHSYMNVQILTSDNFCGHQGTDLFDPDKVNYRTFEVKKLATLREFMELISEQMKYPIEMIRPWPLIYRPNHACRPVAIDLEVDCEKAVIDIADNSSPWTVFLETVEPDSGLFALQEFNKETDVLLFFKLYDPKHKRMSYCGHTYMSINARARALVPVLNERAGFPEDTELMLFEEVKPNVVVRIAGELMDGDIIIFQRADINFSDYELPTAKEYFWKNRHVSSTASGEDLSRRDEHGWSPLHHASINGDVEKVRELVQRGANTRLMDRRGKTPLHQALCRNEEAAAEILATADPWNDVQDEEGFTPLHLAARGGCIKIIKQLLAGGSETRIQSRCGMTALHHALWYRREAAAELLGEADPQNEVQDESGFTPLHLAAGGGYMRVIRLLLACGSRTRVKDSWGRTPIHRALWCEKDAAAELLVEADPKNDDQDKGGFTPLHMAAQGGCVRTLMRLLASGSRTRIKDVFGKTPIHYALWCKREAAAELLAEADPTHQEQDEEEFTPLHLAVHGACEGVVRKMVHCGTNPHIKDCWDEFPIQRALWGRNENIPKLIISMYALNGIPLDWNKLQLAEEHQQFCIKEVSLCEAEIQLMRRTRVPAASISYHYLVTRHVSRVALHLQMENVQRVSRSDLARQNFAIYADLIAPKLLAAEERRIRMEQCFECFSLLLPPLLPTCTVGILLCLSDVDMENFLESQKWRSSCSQ